MLRMSEKEYLKITGKTVSKIKSKQAAVIHKIGLVSNDPQERLYCYLVSKLGQDRVRKEVEGLIPGRRYRADIVIDQNIVFEFDGFAYHRSKTAFQKDRERQNLFVHHGYRVYRFFAKQILEDPSVALKFVPGQADANALHKSCITGRM